MLTAVIRTVSSAIFSATSKAVPAQQHEPGEQRRHRGIALGIDQRERETAGKARRLALARLFAQGWRGGDTPSQPHEIQGRRDGDDGRGARHRQQQPDQAARRDRHDRDHAHDDADEIAHHPPRAEGSAGGSEAQCCRTGAAGKRNRSQ
jgi:hypothetical protein